MDAHQIPETIEWHEGLLLTPQHFQQLSLRHEWLLRYVSASIAPFGWGVRRSPKIDDASLVGGTLKVIQVEAVMPDRLVVSRRAGRDEDLSKDLKPYAEEMKKGPVAVHLAVVAREGNAPASGDGARYDSVDGDPVADESTGDGMLRIPRLRPRLSLRVPDLPPDNNDAGKYVSFPLFKVVHNENGFALSDFVPPTLSLTRESPLGGDCMAAARSLRSKARELADKLGGPGAGARAHLDLAAKSMIRDLVAPLPALEAVLNTDASHPFQVYLALCSVVGHLSVMGNEMVPPDFEPYDHDDLRATFKPVLDCISRKIEEGVVSSFERHWFRHEGAGVFSLPFKRAWADSPLQLGMHPRAGAGEQEVAEWGRECLIGSSSQIQWMKEKRHTGADRAQLGPDESFAAQHGVVVFSLQPQGFVNPGEDLQIINTGERGRPAEIVLYVGKAS